MTKNETQIMKGVAILLMLFLHLLNREENVNLCYNTFNVLGMPFVYWLQVATNPVSFFVVLSGYGMHYIYTNDGKDKHRWSRVFKLYLHLWVILAIFTGIAHFKNINYYTDIVDVIRNYTAFNCTWNGEVWFLFPFVCLSLLSPYIFKIIDRMKTIWILVLFYFMNLCTCFVISRFGEQYLYKNMLLYNPFLILHLVPSFVYGAIIHRTGIVSKFQTSVDKSEHKVLSVIAVIITLMSMVFIMCIVRRAFFIPLYASAFIILFLLLPRNRYLDICLAHLGNHSMNMWLIHTWFCYYLFHSEIYSLRYPILIYLALITVSLLSSCVINGIIGILSKMSKGISGLFCTVS